MEGHAPSWPPIVVGYAHVVKRTDATERVPPDGMDEKLPQRKTPIHLSPVASDNRSIIVFLTVCTEKRKPILACGDVHQLLITSWRMADAWTIGRYVVMSDHIHLFCAPSGVEPVA